MIASPKPHEFSVHYLMTRCEVRGRVSVKSVDVILEMTNHLFGERADLTTYKEKDV